jgi:hypothetical protein
MADVPATYRIEHRHDGTGEVLAYTSDAHAPATALAPGELVLIEQSSGRVVARQPLWTPPATQEVP